MMLTGFYKECDMTNKRYCFLLYVLILCFSPFLVYAQESETVKIKDVLDGDTVVLEDGRRVRYLCINTTEWQEPFSLKAKRLNRELVNKREAKLELDTRKVDGYKRLLAYVYVNNEMINSRLVKEGLAHVLIIHPNTKHSKLLLDLQKKAKAQKKGMWSLYNDSITLKITQLKPRQSKKGKGRSSYIRIANISNKKVNIGGYSLSNSKGKKYTFTHFDVQPGYSFIISGRPGTDGYNKSGQLTIHWKEMANAWNKKKGKALLFNPSGKLIGVYRYKGRRIFYGIYDKE